MKYDRTMVIKGLFEAAKVIEDHVPERYVGYAKQAIWDALALLREQEPVKPKFDSLDGNVGRWRCGNCQASLGAVRPPYCWHCGKAVKWNA